MTREEGEQEQNEERKRQKGSWVGWRKMRRKKNLVENLKKKKLEEDKNSRSAEKCEEESEIYQTVIFIQHIKESTLAKRIREKLKLIEESGGKIKIKLVERPGEKTADLLHKSYAWDDRNCLRSCCDVWMFQRKRKERGMQETEQRVRDILC